MTFLKELRDTINSHSKEIVSDTPDFILAKYLNHCLDAFDNATLARSDWLRGAKAEAAADEETAR